MTWPRQESLLLGKAPSLISTQWATPPLSGHPASTSLCASALALNSPINNPWYVWTVLSCASTFGIASERTQLGAMLSSPLVTMGVSMLLCNIGLLPKESSVYTVVLKWLVPMSIPLLLLDADLKKCLKDTGTLLSAFLVGSLGTLLGTLAAFLLVPMKFAGDGGPKIAAALCARHIGGAVNFVAVADILAVRPDLMAAAMAADNVVVAAYFAFLFLISVPERNDEEVGTTTSSHTSSSDGSTVAQAVAQVAKCPIPMFRSPDVAPAAAMLMAPVSTTSVSVAASPLTTIDEPALPMRPAGLSQQRREKYPVSLLGVSVALSIALVLSSLSLGLSLLSRRWIPGGASPMLLVSLLAVCTATAFPATLSRVSKAGGVVGVLFMQLFFGVTGGQGHIPTVLSYGPSLFLHTTVQIAVHFCVAVGLGRYLGLPFREIVLASNANVGGPTTAAGMATTKRWKSLVLPALLTGILGYAIATGLGVLIFQVLVKL